MSFILMTGMSLVPLFLGISNKMMFKMKLTNGIFLFMVCMSLWQLDVSVLFGYDFLKQNTIFFLFKLFRIGSIMIPPTFLYVGYVTVKHLSGENENWLKWIFNKYIVGAYYLGSIFLYLINWTSLGITDLKIIAGLGLSNVLLFYPIPGTFGALFDIHFKLIIFSILLTILASRRVIDRNVKLFLTSFSFTFLLTYFIGVLNLQAATFLYSSQLNVMIFSVIVFFIFINMSTKILKESNKIVKRIQQEKQIEISTSGLIHEIRNPLTIINGYTELLAQNVSLNIKDKGMVDHIQIAGSHMNGLLFHYNEFINSGKINIEETDILEIVKESMALTSIRANEANVTILLNASKQGLVKIDRDKMRQVFINLINNSIEAMNDREQKIIKIKTNRSNNDINVIFADTGSGIPKHKWEEIFIPFHSTKEPGRGLGLSISQRILHSHGGNIEIIKSNVKGTEIKVAIPSSYLLQ